jgi:hypothetical protein
LVAVISTLGIEKELFEKTYAKLANSHEHCEYVMAAQQGKLKKIDPQAPGVKKISK